MGVVVIVGYRPHAGKEAQLLDEIRQHVPDLRAEGLATDRDVYILRSASGVIVEVFEWVSKDAIAQAHQNVLVAAMWERFASCCDYVPVNELPEVQDLFAEFSVIE